MNLKKIKEYKRISYLYAFYKMMKSIINKYLLPLTFSNYGYRAKTSDIRIPCTCTPSNMFLYEYTRIGDGFRLIANKGRFVMRKYSVLASNCTVITHNHCPTVSVPQFFLSINHINDSESDIIVEEDVWIGYGVTLLKGAHCGRGCICAANSLINKEVPPYAVVAGCPAKIIAVSFSIEQIIEHEKNIYFEEERFSESYLKELFESYYVGKKIYGTKKMSHDDICKLENYLNETDYIFP